MLRRKSKWRSKNQRRARSAASIAWAEETRRLARQAKALAADAALLGEAAEPNVRPGKAPKGLLRFRVTIECLTDGERVQFTTAEGPHGLTISPSLAGRKVAAVLKHYRPA